MSKSEVLEAIQSLTLRELLELIEVAFARLRQLASSTDLESVPNQLHSSQGDLAANFLRISGQDKGKVFISVDFDDPLPDDVLGRFMSTNCTEPV